jgi:hypothetical protein
MVYRALDECNQFKINTFTYFVMIILGSKEANPENTQIAFGACYNPTLAFSSTKTIYQI